MSDLISRKETEKILREYADDVGCDCGEVELANGILKAVCCMNKPDVVPTAYDVEKVIRELERLQNYSVEKSADYDERGEIRSMEIADAYADAYSKAIKIVKKGGA